VVRFSRCVETILGNGSEVWCWLLRQEEMLAGRPAFLVSAAARVNLAAVYHYRRCLLNYGLLDCYYLRIF